MAKLTLNSSWTALDITTGIIENVLGNNDVEITNDQDEPGQIIHYGKAFQFQNTQLYARCPKGKAEVRVSPFLDATVSGSSSGGSSNTYTLPTASATTKGGVKVGSGLKITTAGVLSVDTKGEGVQEWQANTAYAAGDYVQYDSSLYIVSTAFTSGSTFDDTNLTEIGGTSGDAVVDWEPATDYVINQLVNYEGLVYLCLIDHTSSNDFEDDLTAGQWKQVSTGGAGAGVTYQQTSVVDITASTTAPYTVQCNLNSNTSYCRPPVEVLRLTDAETNITEDEVAFENTDATKFKVNGEKAKYNSATKSYDFDYVELVDNAGGDSIIKEKTEYEYSMKSKVSIAGTDIDGNACTFYIHTSDEWIDPNNYKSVTDVEVG